MPSRHRDGRVLGAAARGEGVRLARPESCRGGASECPPSGRAHARSGAASGARPRSAASHGSCGARSCPRTSMHPRLMTSADGEEDAAPVLGPPISWPRTTSSPVRVASRIVVRNPGLPVRFAVDLVLFQPVVSRACRAHRMLPCPIQYRPGTVAFPVSGPDPIRPGATPQIGARSLRACRTARLPNAASMRRPSLLSQILGLQPADGHGVDLRGQHRGGARPDASRSSAGSSWCWRWRSPDPRRQHVAAAAALRAPRAAARARWSGSTSRARAAASRLDARRSPGTRPTPAPGRRVQPHARAARG